MPFELRRTSTIIAASGLVTTALVAPGAVAGVEPEATQDPLTPRQITEDIDLCAFRAGLFAAGSANSTAETAIDFAAHDLAALLIRAAPTDVASVDFLLDGNETPMAVGIRVIPADAGYDVDQLIADVSQNLEPPFQEVFPQLVLEVADPVGYGFDDVCGAYLDLSSKAEEFLRSQDPGVQPPYESLGIELSTATVVVGTTASQADAARGFGYASAPHVRFDRVEALDFELFHRSNDVDG